MARACIYASSLAKTASIAPGSRVTLTVCRQRVRIILRFGKQPPASSLRGHQSKRVGCRKTTASLFTSVALLTSTEVSASTPSSSLKSLSPISQPVPAHRGDGGSADHWRDRRSCCPGDIGNASCCNAFKTIDVTAIYDWPALRVDLRNQHAPDKQGNGHFNIGHQRHHHQHDTGWSMGLYILVLSSPILSAMPERAARRDPSPIFTVKNTAPMRTD